VFLNSKTPILILLSSLARTVRQSMRSAVILALHCRKHTMPRSSSFRPAL
jgi:hypothetical protein